MPFRSGGHAAESGAFTILRFPETSTDARSYGLRATPPHSATGWAASASMSGRH
jgi:hypothetical protein